MSLVSCFENDCLELGEREAVWFELEHGEPPWFAAGIELGPALRRALQATSRE